jgi:DNA-binding transcriptional LysR family regulator
MSQDPDWGLYCSFLAVLETGSLSAAARMLDLTQPTLARHVDTLEATLGCQLFLRSPHGLAATDAAEALRPHAVTMAATAAALRRTASGIGATPRGVVRITASDVVGIEVLPPILAGLRACHPGIAVELALTDAVEDLLRRDADIAVRMVAPQQDALVARKIGDIPLGLFGHPDYLARKGVPTTVADLERHDVIGYDTETPALRALAARMPAFRRDDFALRTDSNVAQLAAIRAGFGLGGAQVPLGARYGLTRVLPDAVDLALHVWLVVHEDLKASPRCRVVFDALAEGLTGYIRGASA